MNTFIHQAPAKLAVSLDEVRQYLRVEDDGENAMLTSIAQSAIDYCERYTGRGFVTQQWDEIQNKLRSRIVLTKAPFQSVASITYYDEDNNIQTLPSVAYDVIQQGSQPAELHVRRGVALPEVYDRPDAVTVRYNVGYGDTWQDVPASLRRAVMALIVHYYENRGVVGNITDARFNVPYTLTDALDQFRVYWQ